MKHSLLTLLLASGAWASMQAQEIPLVNNIYGRQNTITLNGAWDYIVDVQERGFYDYRMNETRWGFFLDQHQKDKQELVEYNFDTSPKMNVPGDWNTQDEQLFFYEGTVWLRRNFDYSPTPGKRTVLYFGAVNYEAIVYVNGQKMGKHVGGFTPFNFDITSALKEGKNNVIVKVDNKRTREQIPTNIYDWWNYGGITRDVLLTEVDETYVEDYSLQLDKQDWKHLTGWVKLNNKVAGEKVSVNIPELKVKTEVVTDNEGRAEISVKAKPTLWSPENPKLYNVSIARGEEIISDEIGFRCIETQGKQILLNGQPIFMRGISLHEEAPFGGGRTTHVSQSRTLLEWAKELNCNYVRMAHYPHSELEVREAEKMGIMVWDEIPVYWTIAWENQETYANAERQLHDMINRDKNRAAVVIWSIANETPHSDPRDKFLSSLAKYARTQDNSRLISMAMEVTSANNYHNKLNDNMHEYVDVVSFNQYVGWYRDVNDASKMTWEVPYNKPVIVSEFGGGARYGLHADKDTRWSEEFQENLYIENLKMLDKIEGLAGLSPWILKDFRSPARYLPDVQDYYNRKGLVSEQGQKKLSFYVMQQYYKEKSEANKK
ncbi:MAG: glycoside hydrolase family 2 TIM barrel-domain containing protein [Bacteroidales bacterium]|nr:glycoside hydrolase family 2 TIM barrel-domain containing protein [Bacteroidales bacterium]